MRAFFGAFLRFFGAFLRFFGRGPGTRERPPRDPGPFWGLAVLSVFTALRLLSIGALRAPAPQPGVVQVVCAVPIEEPGQGVRCLAEAEARARGLVPGAVVAEPVPAELTAPAVPVVSGVQARRMAPERLLTARVRLDLAQASAEELAALPEVGPRLAERIVAARAQGGLRTRADLLRVPGIGARRLRMLAPFLQPLR